MQPNIPLLEQTVHQLKGTIRNLSRQRGIQVVVTRRDGKKLPPRKQDYVAAICKLTTPQLPVDVLLHIFSYDFCPAKFRLLSKEMNRAANEESFYLQVCRKHGYFRETTDTSPVSASGTSYRKFFLENVDVSRLKRIFLCGGMENCRVVVCTPPNAGSIIGRPCLGAESLTAGQLRHVVNEFYPGMFVPLPRNPTRVVHLTSGPDCHEVFVDFRDASRDVPVCLPRQPQYRSIAYRDGMHINSAVFAAYGYEYQ